MTTPAARPTCLLTFDVEEHFQIEAARPYIPPAAWSDMPSRVEGSVNWLLEQLDAAGAKATFFTLGYVARRHAGLVRAIVQAGHELACHGDAHDRLHALSRADFREDLRRSLDALEDAGERAVRGYRAPTFSLTRQTAWAVDVLAEEGISYDSSVHPVNHPQYGEPEAPRWAYRLVGPGGREVLEIPPVTWQFGPLRLPVAGGGYFRLLPLTMMRLGIAQSAREDQPAMLYFHPWEFDPAQPRLPLGRLASLRTYVGMEHTRSRLTTLLREYASIPVERWLKTARAAQWPTYQLPPAQRVAA